MIGYGCGSLPTKWHKYKAELYLSSMWYFFYLTAAERAARRIYHRETTQGLQRRQRDREAASASAAAIAANTATVEPRRHSTFRRSWPMISRHVGRQYARISWTLLSLLVPAWYVHVVSFLGAITSKESVWLYMGASIALKVCMQEAAKWFILSEQVYNPRAMVMLVAVPTVLIDTQVRLMFLRFQSVQVTMATTLGMALAELWVRLMKTLLTRWQIHRKRRQLQQQRRRTVVTALPPPAVTVAVPQLTTGGDNDEDESFQLWKAQLHQYHTTELVADMYAEYLAIGCSSAIVFVLGGHPQYSLRAGAVSASTGSDSGSIYWQLLVQVAVEALVDFLCCCGEIAGGQKFSAATRERGFYLVLFIVLAVVNVNLSAIFYLA